jgi:hypothetical protein
VACRATRSYVWKAAPGIGGNRPGRETADWSGRDVEDSRPDYNWYVSKFNDPLTASDIERIKALPEELQDYAAALLGVVNAAVREPSSLDTRKALQRIGECALAPLPDGARQDRVRMDLLYAVQAEREKAKREKDGKGEDEQDQYWTPWIAAWHLRHIYRNSVKGLTAAGEYRKLDADAFRRIVTSERSKLRAAAKLSCAMGAFNDRDVARAEEAFKKAVQETSRKNDRKAEARKKAKEGARRSSRKTRKRKRVAGQTT